VAFKFNAILKFNGEQAVRGLGRASRGFRGLQKHAASLRKSMDGLNQGIRGGAIATAPFAIGVAFATKTAADFEEQMSVVKSVILGTTEEMDTLNEVTKRLGATTAFTAKEAGEGAEFLARAGFSATQITSALPGVLDAAAASGVGLGEAADIIAGQIGAFGLKAEQAGEVADALSLTTALTNTNFTQLGEAMKFAAPIAKQAGLSLSATATAMGVLANAGVKGSLAGTALKNALNKLAKPSKESLKLFGGRKGLNAAVLETVNVGGKLVTRLKPLEVIMANVSKAVQSAKDPLEATGRAAEIFGLRGTTAFSSFAAKLTDTTKITEKNIDALRKGVEKTGENIDISLGGTIPALVALRLQLAGSSGTAAEMARIRLDNVKGQFTLLNSAVQGLSIELGSLVTGPLKGLLKTATDIFSVVTIGFQAATKGGEATGAQIASLKDNQFKGMLDFAIEFAQGFIQGFNDIKNAAKAVFRAVANFLEPIIGATGMTAKEIGSIVAKIILVGAIAAPILATLAAGFFVLGPIIAGVSGAISAIGAIFGIVASVGSILIGVVTFLAGVVGAPFLLIAAGIAAVVVGIYFFRDEIFAGFMAVVNFLADVFSPVITVMKFLGALAFEVAKQIAQPFLWLVGIYYNNVVKPIASGFMWLWTTVTDGAVAAFNSIVGFLTPVVSAIIGAFKYVGGVIFDVLSFPIRAVFSMIKGIIKGIASTTIGRKALSLAGLDIGELNKSLAALPGVEAMDQASGITTESRGIANEKVANAALTQPPSAKETASATASAVAGQAGGGAQGASGPQKVQVEVVGKIKGKDLNLVQTRAQVDQSERNGRQIDPAVKRKLLQNGAQAVGV